MGVTRLPKFAATVSITTVKISLFSLCPLISIIVKGTKVISATSFVISMEVKKHTAHSAAAWLRVFFIRLVTMSESLSKVSVKRHL